MPTSPPTARNASIRCCKASVVQAMAADPSSTIVEWPRENMKPTVIGRFPSCISLRVTLSIAAIWSASTAWRRPKL